MSGQQPEIDVDLDEVRARLTDLRVASVSVATDLLGVLSAMHDETWAEAGPHAVGAGHVPRALPSGDPHSIAALPAGKTPLYLV